VLKQIASTDDKKRKYKIDKRKLDDMCISVDSTAVKLLLIMSIMMKRRLSQFWGTMYIYLDYSAISMSLTHVIEREQCKVVSTGRSCILQYQAARL